MGENSDKCRKDMLVKTHGHMYAVMSLILCGTRFAWPAVRARLYFVCIHKIFLGTLVCTFANIIPLFDRKLAPDGSYLSLFSAHEEPELAQELLSELDWAVHRPSSLSSGECVDHMALNSADPFRAALNSEELECLESYEKANDPAKCPDGFTCQLNQRVKNGRNVSSSAAIMYTLTAQSSLHYCTALGRWATPMETLLLQGFPVLTKFTSDKRCCSFAKRAVGDECPPRPVGLPAYVPWPPVRGRNRVFQQAGNSMQLVTVGYVLMYTFLFIDLKADSPELDEFMGLF